METELKKLPTTMAIIHCTILPKNNNTINQHPSSWSPNSTEDCPTKS